MLSRRLMALLEKYKHFPVAMKALEGLINETAAKNPMKIPPEKRDVEEFVQRLANVKSDIPRPEVTYHKSVKATSVGKDKSQER